MVINDKSRGGLAAHLRFGGLFSYYFIKYLSLSLIVKNSKSVNT